MSRAGLSEPRPRVMRINLVLIGPPGSGKGTQAARLARHFRVPHISTGDILREAVRADTPLGRQVAATVASGALVSDSLMIDLVRERLAQPDTARGFILDGFPRTALQADLLDGIPEARPLIVALIDVEPKEIVRRLSRRRICDSCHITQSVTDESQKDPCPYCGGTLVRRDDDAPETVIKRLQTYAAYAEPVIAHYRDRPTFFTVAGARDPSEVTSALVRAIEEKGDYR
jgi:adenylate kinase